MNNFYMVRYIIKKLGFYRHKQLVKKMKVGKKQPDKQAANFLLRPAKTKQLKNHALKLKSSNSKKRQPPQKENIQNQNHQGNNQQNPAQRKQESGQQKPGQQKSQEQKSQEQQGQQEQQQGQGQEGRQQRQEQQQGQGQEGQQEQQQGQEQQQKQQQSKPQQNESEQSISTSIQNNLQQIKQILGDSYDLKQHEFKFGKGKTYKAAVVYIDGLADTKIISSTILKSLIEYDYEKQQTFEGQALLDHVKQEILYSVDIKPEQNYQEILKACFNGSTALFLDGC